MVASLREENELSGVLGSNTSGGNLSLGGKLQAGALKPIGNSDDSIGLGFDNIRGRNFAAVDITEQHSDHARLNISDRGVGVTTLGQAC